MRKSSNSSEGNLIVLHLFQLFENMEMIKFLEIESIPQLKKMFRTNLIDYDLLFSAVCEVIGYSQMWIVHISHNSCVFL